MTRGDFCESSRSFGNHDLTGTVDLPCQSDEAACLLTGAGQVKVAATHRVEDGVPGHVTVAERAEAAGACLAAVLTAGTDHAVPDRSRPRHRAW